MLGNLAIGAGAGGGYSTLLILVVFLGLMYFLMLRPQQKQQKKHKDMMSQLKKGDHVITISRLHGVIDEINQADQTVTLDCDGIYLVFDLRAIAQVTSQAPQAVTAPVSADTTSASADTPAENTDEAASDEPAEKTDDESAK
ncbi:preprotein translocase subunit YajC [Levilactobacillus brevis]|uniref:preprotein translocase subunit YajC n=1 Tax=Levilactobacillus brevis TaxID=1580 RepID=UPI0020CEE259|nr:preprotein translocase subunit YajC [Levilactobacillus brevis]